MNVELRHKSALALGAIIVGALIGLGLRPLVAAPVRNDAPLDAPKVAGLDPLQIPAGFNKHYGDGSLKIVDDDHATTGLHYYEVSFISNDIQEFARLVVPTGVRPSAGWPVIVVAHGYMNPDEYQSTGDAYAAEITKFAASGFAVLRPDYRGHGLSGGVAEGGYYSPGYTNDVLNLIGSLSALPMLNAKDVGIWGHSMGGYVALRAAVINPSIKAVVLAAGSVGDATSMWNWQPNSIMFSPTAQSVKQRLAQKYGIPADNPGFWDTTVPITYVSRLRAAVQIHHGGADEQVPVDFSVQLDQALTRTSHPHEYYYYPGGDHSFSGDVGQQMIARSLEFFRSNLRPGG